jgi:hypothetical protein
MELWDYDGTPPQRWRIVSLGDGYYKILSGKSELALSVQADYVNKSGKKLVQEAYTGATRQQWSITKNTSRGTYIIRPRSGESYSKDWCMCAGSQFLGITDGLNVEQKEYDNDSNYKDEWYLYDVHSVTLLAYNENTEYDRSAYFAQTASHLNSAGITDVYTEYYTSYSVSDMIQSMQRSTVFYIQTHANYNNFQISNSGSSLTMSDLAGVDLSNIGFALLLTCYTALDGYNQERVSAGTPYNMVEQFVVCGAKTVIGFTDEVWVDDCNNLARYLTEQIFVNRMTVQSAVDRAKNLAYYHTVASLAEVGGDKHKVFS